MAGTQERRKVSQSVSRASNHSIVHHVCTHKVLLEMCLKKLAIIPTLIMPRFQFLLGRNAWHVS